MAGSEGQSLHRLVYRSQSLMGCDAGRDLTDILRQSEANNSHANITGCLALAGSTFVQVIEGTGGDIAQLMERVRVDQRHHAISVLADRPISARLFRGWAMARITFPPLSPELVGVVTKTGGAAHVTGILLGLMEGSSHGFGVDLA